MTFDSTYALTFAQLSQLQKSPEDMERLSKLKYHLDSGDYFAFLATVFAILEDTFTSGAQNTAEQLALIQSMRKDLVFLQQKYQIGSIEIEN